MYLKRSRQQLNNPYWVAYKSFICCDQVQLEFEPWTDEARNGEIYFQIKVSHNRKDFVGWLLSFNSNHVINPKRSLRILSKDPSCSHLSQRCLKTKVHHTSEQNKSLLNLPIFLVTYWILPRITSLTTNHGSKIKYQPINISWMAPLHIAASRGHLAKLGVFCLPVGWKAYCIWKGPDNN